MQQKQKRVWIVNKVMRLYALLIAIIALVFIVSLMAESIGHVYAKVLIKDTDIIKVNQETRKNDVSVGRIAPRKSSMQLMITGKETVKGDRVEKILKKQKAKKKYAKENLDLMAHLINAEAGNQSDECQQAAGMVVLNRVKSKVFKQNTIRDSTNSHLNVHTKMPKLFWKVKLLSMYHLMLYTKHNLGKGLVFGEQ